MKGTVGMSEQGAWSFVLCGELQVLQYGGSVGYEVEVENGGTKGVTGAREKVLNVKIMSLDLILRAVKSQ